jgi:Mrp family chromosome partitioning ATPase
MMLPVDSLSIAVVSRDQAVREAIAERFDCAPPGWSVTLFEERPPGADIVVRGPDVAVDADVVFDPDNPERLLTDVEALTAASSKTYVVTGAGRGTGVTSAAVHLAGSLAGSHETCFVDLDSSWAGARDRLGMGGRTVLTWAEAGDDAESLRRAAIPVASGFRALLAPLSGDPPDGLIERVRTSFPHVVVDLPAGEPDHGVLRSATAALLLVPPTPAGLARARVVLARPTRRWAVIVSRTGHGGEAGRAEIEERLQRKVALELPCTPLLRDAEDQGRLLRGPWTRYNRRIARLAAGLEAL